MTANPLTAFGTWLAETPRDWPDDARDWAHREFVDTVAVMVPGAAEPVARKTFATVADWGADGCAVVGHAKRLAAPWAALVNGAAGHALDFDDNFDPSKSHPSTVLVPALLALGEQEGKSGRACIDAYIAGLQIMGRVGQGLNPTHRDRGWHATSTVGAVGAAAACARLLKLDTDGCARALSLATSMAGGFMSQFGTMAKPLHAGLAAKAGVMAASLARQGVTASEETLEGKTSMQGLMVGPDYEELRDRLTHFEHGHALRYETERVGEPLLILEHKFRVKRFPCCGVSHRAMDGLLDLMAAHGFSRSDVKNLRIRLPQLHQNNLMHHDPKTSLEAKFSQEYTIACILLTGDCTLEDFTEQAINRPEIREVYELLELEAVDLPEGQFPTEVKVTLKDGQVLETAVGLPRGSKAAPFTWDEYWLKFDMCCKNFLTPERTGELRGALERLPNLVYIADLTEHLATPFARVA
ncbi:MAG: MmgE/PrpD family protein [Alphaproteobacteria bacterium]